MSDPKTADGWGTRVDSVWRAAGMGFPVDVKLVMLDYTKRYSEPITKIKGHDVTGVEGMLVRRKSKGDWCVLYDETVEVEGRINFTLGHEFGHYLLHRETRDEFQCGLADVLDYDSPESRRREAEANRFASCLLMPADDFRGQVYGQRLTLDLLGHCANRYGTSFTATALKWIELADECAMLVVARDGFICWSYPSQQARRQGIYLPPGTPVPQSSLDQFSGIVSSESRNQSRRVSPGVWDSKLEAEESVIVSDRFDLAIFLVRFPMAELVEHEEEDELDAFDVLIKRDQRR